MKKTYIAPTGKLISVELESHILGASSGKLNLADDESFGQDEAVLSKDKDWSNELWAED